jgi:hypothetical protein
MSGSGLGFSPLPQATVAEFTPGALTICAGELFHAALYWTTLGQVDRAIQCHQAAALYLQAAAAIANMPSAANFEREPD